MTILDAGILGVVEGLTEFLPVSSTAHLLIASRLLGLEQSDTQKLFEIAIQSGAIFAVIVMYFKTLVQKDTILKLIAAFIPTGIVGLTLYPLIKGYFLTHVFVSAYALIIGGIFMIGFEYWLRSKNKEGMPVQQGYITYKQALLVGAAQSLAVVPGVSRSGASILGGLALGLTREKIVEFSFLLAVPTILAATALDIVKHRHELVLHDGVSLLVGALAAFVTAFIVIKSFLHFIRSYDLIPFGVYRIVVGVLTLIFLM